MEIYNFKCKNCGATKYVKVDDNIFECQYCGYREELLKPESNHESESIEIDKPEVSDSQTLQKSHESAEKTTSDKEKCLNELKSALLKFFLVLAFGCFGIQHFINGRILLGLVYVCTFGIFFFGWIIDGIIYFVKLLTAILNYLGAQNE